MSDKRKNRGPHPKDHELFAAEHLDNLRAALGDLCWLLGRGYARTSALKLVGDRHSLQERQRMALNRVACSDSERDMRIEKKISPDQTAGKDVNIDGFNLITTIEAALSGGLMIRCRDGCIRDLASMHGNYRKVSQTLDAATLIGKMLESLNASQCNWYLDRPVSNSGKLKTILEEIARDNDWNWSVALDYSPDKVLKESSAVAISGDSIILNECQHWLNLTPMILEQNKIDCWLIDLG